ncbi:MAG TPA: HNH endonuclease signature motif containing protein [Candidatus Polarisedimenticolia bacterium]
MVPLAHRVEGWYSAFGEDPDMVAREMLSDAGRKRPICFLAPEETSLQWALTLSHCRAAFGMDAAPSDSQVVAVLLLNFLSQWAAPEILKESRKHTIFTRDGWICRVPGCRSRADLHAHHLVFRSRGGPDAAWNVATVCAPHHRMIHAGFIQARGRAPGDLEWCMGVNAAGDVRERFRNGTRVECDPGWRAGADSSPSLPSAAARG